MPSAEPFYFHLSVQWMTDLRKRGKLWKNTPPTHTQYTRLFALQEFSHPKPTRHPQAGGGEAWLLCAKLMTFKNLTGASKGFVNIQHLLMQGMFWHVNMFPPCQQKQTQQKCQIGSKLKQNRRYYVSKKKWINITLNCKYMCFTRGVWMVKLSMKLNYVNEIHVFRASFLTSPIFNCVDINGSLVYQHQDKLFISTWRKYGQSQLHDVILYFLLFRYSGQIQRKC